MSGMTREEALQLLSTLLYLLQRPTPDKYSVNGIRAALETLTASPREEGVSRYHAEAFSDVGATPEMGTVPSPPEVGARCGCGHSHDEHYGESNPKGRHACMGDAPNDPTGTVYCACGACTCPACQPARGRVEAALDRLVAWNRDAVLKARNVHDVRREVEEFNKARSAVLAEFDALVSAVNRLRRAKGATR